MLFSQLVFSYEPPYNCSRFTIRLYDDGLI